MKLTEPLNLIPMPGCLSLLRPYSQLKLLLLGCKFFFFFFFYHSCNELAHMLAHWASFSSNQGPQLISSILNESFVRKLMNRFPHFVLIIISYISKKKKKFSNFSHNSPYAKQDCKKRYLVIIVYFANFCSISRGSNRLFHLTPWNI